MIQEQLAHLPEFLPDYRPFPPVKEHTAWQGLPLRAKQRFLQAGEAALQTSGFPSISCLSYNERSNWLTIASLGFYVRRKDCQSSSCCSVRFEQVEPPDAGEFASHNRLNRQREKMDSGCRFLVLEECK